jgi:hypothetical protein
MNTDELTVPKFLFERTGVYYLITIKPDSTVSWDGPHSKPTEVATAKKLYESISCIRLPKGTRYLMIRIDEVPSEYGEINQEAIDTLNNIRK